MEKYINKTKKLDERFKKTFNTNYSFVLQYEELYNNKLYINGVDSEKSNWLDIMQSMVKDFNKILSDFSEYKGISQEKAFKILIKYLEQKEVFS